MFLVMWKKIFSTEDGQKEVVHFAQVATPFGAQTVSVMVNVFGRRMFNATYSYIGRHELESLMISALKNKTQFNAYRVIGLMDLCARYLRPIFNPETMNAYVFNDIAERNMVFEPKVFGIFEMNALQRIR